MTTHILLIKDKDVIWLVSCAVITAVAACLRFFWLELKPLHHDEGVNGHFLINLFNDGKYQYDPTNYHGPDLYYISLAFAKIFGLNTLSIRSSVAIFGVLTVILAFFLRRYIGKIGSLAAAVFLTLSPGMVYISRYFIHEMLFVFFSLAIVVSVLFFINRRSAGIFAAMWMAVLLMVCFISPSLNAANFLAGENTTALWILRSVVLLVDAALVYLLVRLLLNWDKGRPIIKPESGKWKTDNRLAPFASFLPEPPPSPSLSSVAKIFHKWPRTITVRGIPKSRLLCVINSVIREFPQRKLSPIV